VLGYFSIEYKQQHGGDRNIFFTPEFDFDVGDMNAKLVRKWLTNIRTYRVYKHIAYVLAIRYISRENRRIEIKGEHSTNARRTKRERSKDGD
jgi:hypothetical protein